MPGVCAVNAGSTSSSDESSVTQKLGSFRNGGFRSALGFGNTEGPAEAAAATARTSSEPTDLGVHWKIWYCWVDAAATAAAAGTATEVVDAAAAAGPATEVAIDAIEVATAAGVGASRRVWADQHGVWANDHGEPAAKVAAGVVVGAAAAAGVGARQHGVWADHGEAAAKAGVVVGAAAGAGVGGKFSSGSWCIGVSA